MTDWTELKSPSLAEFEAIADACLAQLPETFRALCDGVVIRIDEFPEDAVLNDLEAETPFDLLGLFTGVAGVIRAQTGVVLDAGAWHPVLWICPVAMIALCALGGVVPAFKAYRVPVAETLAPVS